jgi:hypothetical protein
MAQPPAPTSITVSGTLNVVHQVDPGIAAGLSSLTGLVNARFAAVMQQFTVLQKQVQTMGTTLSGQLDTVTQTLAADMGGLATDLTTIAGELQPGSTITQAQVDALNAVATSANQLKQQADSLAQATAAPAPAAPAQPAAS